VYVKSVVFTGIKIEIVETDFVLLLMWWDKIRYSIRLGPLEVLVSRCGPEESWFDITRWAPYTVPAMETDDAVVSDTQGLECGDFSEPL
jgi:hypothetical protein